MEPEGEAKLKRRSARMKCELCEAEGKKSKIFMGPPVARGVNEDEIYFDEEGVAHKHVTPGARTATVRCTNGHTGKIIGDNICGAKGCDYGEEEKVEWDKKEGSDG